MQAPSLQRYVWLSIAAAVTTITLKGVAWWLTLSVGLLSDALESFVNLGAALLALWLVRVAEAPEDEQHAWGHGKAEYFSSAFEGALIVMAAMGIGFSAVTRFVSPAPLEHVGVGLAVSVAASLVNFIVSRVLLSAGKKHHSILLEADAQHLMSDVWTSVAVIAAVALVGVTGWWWLDPLAALLVAVRIVAEGVSLLRRSTSGLMDGALPPDVVKQLEAILEKHRREGLDFHALRTRVAGRRVFLTVHVLVPGAWTVQRGHDFSEALEHELVGVVPNGHVTTHLEPIEDPASQLDVGLDRS